MAFDEALAQRIRERLTALEGIGERRMFGGVCFTLHGNMLVGVVGADLMARVGDDAYEAALAKPGARPMDFTGRPMRGYVFVDPAGTAKAGDLQDWIESARRHVAQLPPKAPKVAGKSGTGKLPARRRDQAAFARGRKDRQ